MAVQKTMNIVAVTGEYTNNQGEQKKSYLTVGTLFIYDDGGMSIKLDAMPIGNGNLSVYEKRDNNQHQAQQNQGYQQQHSYGQPQQQQPQQGQQPQYGNTDQQGYNQGQSYGHQ
jgi:hypothetical protein